MMFPGTEFRSSFAQVTGPQSDDRQYARQTGAATGSYQIAYLWAARIPGRNWLS